MDVVYNASNNELVRTKTLVKNAIVQVDATLFKQWYLQRYGVDLSKKKKGERASAVDEVRARGSALRSFGNLRSLPATVREIRGVEGLKGNGAGKLAP